MVAVLKSPVAMMYRFIFFAVAITLGVSLYAQELPDKQRSLGGRYAQLEQVLLRLAETSASADPRRATLLNKVLLESRDKLIVQRFDTLVNALERRQLADAISGQTNIEQDLLELLKLLESADRNERRDAEKEQIKEFLKEVEELLHSERAVLNQTRQQESQNLPTLEKEQRDVRMKGQSLQDRLAEHEGQSPQNENSADNSAESQEGQSQEGQSQEGQSQEGQSQEGQSQEGQSQEGQSQEGQSQEGQSQEGQSQEGQSQEGQSQEGQNQQQQNQSQQPQTPTQQALQRALDRMRQAEQRLQQAEKDGAIEEQEEAIAELQRLKEELEKILRQIREEELMQTLERLEERLKRMIRVEQAIRAQTERLIEELAGDAMPDQRQIKIRTDRLGIDQQSVVDDAESTLLILREDGTAQAMVESLLQARFDMTEVKKRLDQISLDAITIHMEDAIIDALQEMLEAVQAALEEARERQENEDNQEQQEGMAGEEPLIQLLAELRMIRSMQRRVNERTTRYDGEIQRVLEQPEPNLRPFMQAVEELARQQNRISRILHELRVGRIR